MKKILRKLKGIKNFIIFLDFDGTIVPIEKSPELVKLHPMRRRFLGKLSSKISVTIVSGRSLSEIKTLLRLKNISIIGNHGFEILHGGKIWIHPLALELKPLLRKVLKEIKRKTKNFKGVRIEDKGLTGSIHFRLIPPNLSEILENIVKDVIRKTDKKFKIKKGKKALEIRPNLDWDKGKGVKKIISHIDQRNRMLKIYIGDDETDEDAFRVLSSGITILVGRKSSSLAKFRLNNVSEVWCFLKKLWRILQSQDF